MTKKGTDAVPVEIRTKFATDCDLRSTIKWSFPALVMPDAMLVMGGFEPSATIAPPASTASTVGRQLEVPGVITSDVVVCRLMLPPATRSEAMKKAYEPFNRIVREQPDMRSDVMRLALACEELSVKALFVLVNDRAEGSAPRTVKALAEAIVRAREGR